MIVRPLQFGIPGGPELIIILLIAVIISLLPAYFVYKDATKRNVENAKLWTVATLVGGLVGNIAGALLVVVLYLLVVRE